MEEWLAQASKRNFDYVPFVATTKGTFYEYKIKRDDSRNFIKRIIRFPK